VIGRKRARKSERERAHALERDTRRPETLGAQPPPLSRAGFRPARRAHAGTGERGGVWARAPLRHVAAGGAVHSAAKVLLDEVIKPVLAHRHMMPLPHRHELSQSHEHSLKKN